jgi:hypothetical protein
VVIVNVDYRLLHHFRVSQRRQMASRGELPARFDRPDPNALNGFESYEGGVELPEDVGPARVQVLTHLLNEDR